MHIEDDSWYTIHMKEREPESERMMNKFDSRDDNIKKISSLERIHTAKTIFLFITVVQTIE